MLDSSEEDDDEDMVNDCGVVGSVFRWSSLSRWGIFLLDLTNVTPSEVGRESGRVKTTVSTKVKRVFRIQTRALYLYCIN